MPSGPVVAVGTVFHSPDGGPVVGGGKPAEGCEVGFDGPGALKLGGGTDMEGPGGGGSLDELGGGSLDVLTGAGGGGGWN